MENLTHWKKNNDPRYISGDDLANGDAIGKGLRKEMVVVIDRFEDKETFDQSANTKVTKTGFWLKEYPSGKPIYKPVILNNTNADFCITEFKSEFMEHWIGKPLVLYALPHKRHKWVARFKKYYPPAQVTDVNALATLAKANDLSELAAAWSEISVAEQKLPTVLAKKEELKTKLK
jgi:hypothetical protein